VDHGAGHEQRPLLNSSAVILQNPTDEQGGHKRWESLEGGHKLCKVENHCFMSSSKSRGHKHEVSIDNMANEDSLPFVI